jgi:hypothetical protein
MAKRWILILAAMTVLGGTCARAVEIQVSQTIEVMRENCEPFRYADPRRKMLGVPADFRTGVCWGTFASLYHATFLADQNKRRLLHVCPRKDATIVDFIQTFLTFTDGHARSHDAIFALEAHTALATAYPCKRDGT